MKADPPRLLRILGLAFGLSAVIGGMVGQGILRAPGVVAAGIHAPAMIMLAWLLGGLLALVSAAAYGELGAALPGAGGPYDFIRHGLGHFTGTVMGWAAWLGLTTAQGMVSIIFAQFLARLGLFPGLSETVAALCLLSALFALNWTGTRIVGGSQVFFTVFKGLALLALLALLLVLPARAEGAAPPAPLAPAGLAGFVFAVSAILSTYNGWSNMVMFGAEIENPGRSIPRALFGGIAAVTLLYLMVNAALLHVLPVPAMARSSLAAADALGRVLGGGASLVFTGFGIVSVMAVANLQMMACARLSYALACGGDLPEPLTRVAPGGTPRAALATSTALAAVFVVSGTYRSLITLNGTILLAEAIAVNLAAWRLRSRQPLLPRPYRMPLHPLPVALTIGLSLALVAAFVHDDPPHALEGLGLLGLIAAVDFVLRAVRRRRSGTA